MFDKLPAELRTLIYEYVLLEDAPIIIEYWHGSLAYSSAANIRHEQPSAITYNTRGWALFSVTRRCRHEGLCILLSKSHFLCSPDAPGSEDNDAVFSIWLQNDYLRYIRSVSFAMMTNNWYNWAYHSDLVDILLLLNCLYQRKVRLERLFIINAQGRTSSTWLGDQTRLQVAAILLPLAMRYYACGLAQQLYIGTTLGTWEDSEEYLNQSMYAMRSPSPSPWWQDRHLHKLYTHFEAETKDQPCFVTFDAWFTIRSAPLSPTKEGIHEHSIKFKADGLPVSQDLMILLDERIWGQHGLWYGETMYFDKFDAPREYSISSTPPCDVRLRWYSMVQKYGWHTNVVRQQIREHDSQDQVEIPKEDFEQLRDAQVWWELWWAAHLKGQKKITEWLRTPNRSLHFQA